LPACRSSALNARPHSQTTRIMVSLRRSSLRHPSHSRANLNSDASLHARVRRN
jgi:hypothetical protein